MRKDTHSTKQKVHSGQKEAITKATDKDKMCDFYFTNKDFDLIANDLLCHHLATNIFLSAAAVVFEKLLQ